MMKMANYKLTLDINEQKLNILYDALNYYSTMNESMGDQYSAEDVANLAEEVGELYLEDPSGPEDAWQLTPAAKAFMEEYGSGEMIRNWDRWQGFKTAYELQESKQEQTESEE